MVNSIFYLQLMVCLLLEQDCVFYKGPIKTRGRARKIVDGLIFCAENDGEGYFHLLNTVDDIPIEIFNLV